MEHYTFVLEDQPYLGYFQYGNEKTPVYTTDRHGFRVTPGPGGLRATVGDDRPDGPARLLAGSSAVFGVGATGDAATITARLWTAHAPRLPWLNLSGQSHNSAQELLLFTLFQHELPPLEDIVLLSGVNNLVLSRLPEDKQGRHGAFFDCGPAPEAVPPPEQRVAHASELTIRHLAGWKTLADGLGARLAFVLQSLAPWVREEPLPREKLLFDELDEVSNFRRFHNDISTMAVGRAYADRLAAGCARLGVPFLDMNVALGEAAAPEDWLFIDRVHGTDLGYDLVARQLAHHLDLA
ncbi:Inducer of phenazine A [Streptomyces monashensis]|uniref:Inducer of phenazine A n=2 Tax=Streptomyces monashensis TaxID=1678012 RepID=A0A1S2Q2M1_9ACTN|nr:Inducer of phenazine A [Streptomyces monashensis]